MTKQEAIQAMAAGKKVRHYNFSPGEFVSWPGDQYLFEDGVHCEFWAHRKGPEWDIDWELFTEPKQA
jgi:hypothetical protein